MMRKEDIDRFAQVRPFKPFEIRLNDGQRFRFRRIEQFIVGRTTLVTANRSGDIKFINMSLISTIGPLTRGHKRRPRRSSGSE